MGFLEFSWTPWRVVLWCFLSVGMVVMMDALHLLQIRKSCSNATIKIVLQHSSSANSRRSNSDWRANIIVCFFFFLLYIRLYSYFPALFLLTDSPRFLGEETNQTVLTIQKEVSFSVPIYVCVTHACVMLVNQALELRMWNSNFFLRKYFTWFH